MKEPSKTALLLLSLLLVGCGVFLSVSSSTIGASSVSVSSAPVDTVIAGAAITTENGCGPSAVTDVQVLSRRAQPEVGQTFHLLLTVRALNVCGGNPNHLFGVNLKLPEGVEVDPAPGLSGCIVFRSTTPAATTARACQRTSAGSGFERVDPVDRNEWSLRPGGIDTVQVQLAVRARTAGQKTFVGRICDTLSITCLGDAPVANMIPFVNFTVAAVPTIAPEKVKIVKGASPTSTSIRLMAFRFSPRWSGTFRIQRRGPGAANFTTVLTREMSALKLSINPTVTGLSPATTYRFRACFTPTFGTEVCSANLTETTER